MHRERRRVFFSGRVQGVGFRYTCHALARDFDVAGFVGNLPDGRVEVMAEGDSQEVDDFLTAIRREMASYIHDVEAESEPLDASPRSGFTVRY
jgi:acylphosphatase